MNLQMHKFRKLTVQQHHAGTPRGVPAILENGGTVIF